MQVILTHLQIGPERAGSRGGSGAAPERILVSNVATNQRTIENPRVTLGLRNGSATFVIAMVGLLTANIVPLVITVFTDRLGFGLVKTGEIVTWSLAGSAVVGLSTARWASGSRRRLVALIGLSISVLGFGAAALVPDPAVVVAGFIAGGIGAGGALSSSGAAMAAIQNPNRVSATSGFVNRVVVMIALVLLPLIGLAQVTVFGALALIAAIGLALIPWLPNTPELAEPADVTATLTLAAPRRITIAGIALLIVFPFWGMSEDSVYAMTGVMTVQLGISEAQFGAILGAASIVGAVMTGLLLIVGNRIGRALPLGISLGIAGFTKLLIGTATDPTALSVLIVVDNANFGVAMVFFLAAAAGLDARGRWSAPLLSAYIVGSSFAPLFGAFLAETFGVRGFGIVAAIICWSVLIPAVIIARVSTGAERALVRAAERAAEEEANFTERNRERELASEAQ